VEVVRAVDLDIAIGVWPDMAEHGWADDAWPALYERVMGADVLVLAGPIRLKDAGGIPRVRQPALRLGRRLP
jgi:multimeric flavodoxin WrbA